jgi:arylsulfatase A-like enzyme
MRHPRPKRWCAGGVALLSLLACRPDRAHRPVGTTGGLAGSGLSVVLITIDTLRADHLSTYGYRRPTSPSIDALAREGTVFTEAYTFWPKTRGSFVAMLTGKPPSRTGYSKTHPVLLDMNATLASVLKAVGYETTAFVDNPNVAAQLGYAKGFDAYRETWQEKDLATEMDRTRAITVAAAAYLEAARPDRPFLLWLHYVNPHTPYEPPEPFSTMFTEGAEEGPALPVVPGLHGGIPKQWAAPGRNRLGYYIGQYDGEIATVDAEVGRVLQALRGSAMQDKTLVVLTSDHGESLGEHDYYFDHGENLFDPSLRIPLIVRLPGGPAGQRSDTFASTLDLVPTVLDAVKASWPPDLGGTSLLGVVEGKAAAPRDMLYAQNDRNLAAAFGRSFKIVATPEANRLRFALFDRKRDPGEKKDVARSRREDLRTQRLALELFLERSDREWSRTRPLVEGRPGEGRMTPEACERLRAMGYVQEGCR